MNQLRTALIGFGGMGQQYAQMLRDGGVEDMVLTGVCCRNARGQELLRQSYPGVAVYPDADDLFTHSDDFDVLVIVTPHTSHVELGMRAAKAGKHILIDKPAGTTVCEVQELLDCARECHVTCGMIFNVRMYPAYRKAQELLDSGVLGPLQRAVWMCNSWYRSPAYHRSSSWRSTWQGERGGLLINQCQHCFDVWQSLLGMPERIWADVAYGRYNDFQVDDAVDIQMRYANGLHGTFIASSGENPGVNRLEIWGTKGKLCVEDHTKVTLDTNLVDTDTFARTNTEIYAVPGHESREIPVSEDFSDSYQRVFSNFAAHVLRGTPLAESGEDGLNSVTLANGAYLSSWLGQPVTLPLDGAQYDVLLREHIQEEQNSQK